MLLAKNLALVVFYGRVIRLACRNLRLNVARANIFFSTEDLVLIKERLGDTFSVHFKPNIY